MAFQQKSYQHGVEQCWISSRFCSPIVERKGLYRRIPGMHSLSLCTKTREKNQTVQTTEASPYSPLQAKILAHVLLNRLIPTIAQENTPESLCGFRSNRGTIDICVLRQIQEKCREQNMGLYAAFVDLTKAFDTVSHDGLWKILARLACLPKFLTILHQPHEVQQGQVKHNGCLLGSFPISPASSRGVFWPPHCFPSSSASCSVRQTRTCHKAPTSVSEQTAVS